ncbi:class I SAM-dependent methyltransferase [Rhizobium sp. ARZ01]|uniref:class I SAM-dependent methyltransferase n=1 Tax=Rhizobium sp. ARZ01 TaxID=2769313 RepID=UPI0017848F73|nr:class I SAM-dependent methyltransferase [Rhizobium sp. ARZ01]MBD9372923.1 class I SAM-dependent methyltransferase [Rhizobium sp. ARZ01]
MSPDFPGRPPDSVHAERMDRQYRYQRHLYDLTRKYYLFGRDRLLTEISAGDGHSVLEVGCGTGRNIEFMMRMHPQANYFGLDISKEMLETANKRFAPIADNRPRLLVADATKFTAGDFGVTGFDRIVISYALSMIPEWQSAVECALDTLKPGGSLHVVDFGQQERLPPLVRRLLQAWLRRFHVSPRPDLFEVMRGAAERRGVTLQTATPYGGYAWLGVAKLPA